MLITPGNDPLGSINEAEALGQMIAAQVSRTLAGYLHSIAGHSLLTAAIKEGVEQCLSYPDLTEMKRDAIQNGAQAAFTRFMQNNNDLVEIAMQNAFRSWCDDNSDKIQEIVGVAIAEFLAAAVKVPPQKS